ncbi:MAG: hypothetical protein MUO54_01060 [Anaerolineales bacterium]|nr:hypothetical protein [Anaerolineales bacterium]
MNNHSLIPEKTLNWLLEPKDPGVRFLAFTKLTDLPATDPTYQAACEAAHSEGPINKVLDAMHPDGYWEKDGSGYLPKYRSAVWSLILLAQLGASVNFDPRIRKACQHYLTRSLNENGQFSSSGPPSGTVDCLQGNILSALQDLGYADPGIDKAYEWMARSLTGEGVGSMKDRNAPLRYYSGKIGPDFECGANNKLGCAWGATKVMLAFSKLDKSDHTPLIRRAIQRGIDFLFSTDPADGGYPNGWNLKPSGNWWKFGFPVFYVTDILQIAEALVGLGYAQDPRLKNTLQLIRDKQDSDG